MNVSQFELAEALFHRAMEAPPADREALIEAGSQGDGALAARVHRLVRLAAHPARTVAFASPIVQIDLTTEPSAVDPLLGATIGRYRVLRSIGEGGFGVVYEAEQVEPVQRRVALKVLRAGMDSRRVISRFSAERQALAVMDHPGIARIFDAGQTAPALGARPYFVMELVSGEPITTYADGKRLDWRARIELFVAVCHAVQHAHQKGIIHRDIKPSNILIAEVDGIATPKIIDFGIAKALERHPATGRTLVTEAQQLLGTPDYMSPEQVDGEAGAIDTRSDIYSLGVVLYELLIGATPRSLRDLPSTSFTRMQEVIRNQQIERPSTRMGQPGLDFAAIARLRNADVASLRRKLRGDLDWIIMKALEPERERRYSSASALADDLRRFLRNEPVSAGPPSAAYRVRKFIRRHRVGTVATALISVALIAGMVGVVTGLLRVRRAAEQTVAVSDFMRDILTSAAPEKLGADVRLVDVLERGSAAASQRFDGYPATEAQARLLLGEVYLTLDMCTESEREFAAAQALWTEVAGATDRRTVLAALSRVRALLNGLRAREAEDVLADVLPPLLANAPDRDPLRLDAERLGACVDRLRGRMDVAEARLNDLRRRYPQDDDATQLDVLTNLIQVQVAKAGEGTRADAFRTYQEVYRLASEATERATRLCGPHAIPTLRVMTSLADAKLRTGEVREAVALAREIVARAEGRLDPCHANFLNAKVMLARALHRDGDTAAAVALVLERIDCLRSKSLPLMVAGAISDALPMLERAGRWKEGEALAREYEALLVEMGGGHGSMLLSARLAIANFTALQGRVDEAEAEFTELLEIAADPDAAIDCSTFARLHTNYASLLTARGDLENAEKHLLTAAGALPDVRLGTTYANPDDVVTAFLTLYAKMGRADEVERYEKLRQDSHEIAAGRLNPDV